eukprot:215402-Pyramimonas_sp.AAC.1
MKATLDRPEVADAPTEKVPGRAPVALAAASPRAFLTWDPQVTSRSSFIQSPSSHSGPTRSFCAKGGGGEG